MTRGPASPGSSTGNLERNLTLLDELEAIGKDHGLTAAQLAIAWVAAQGEDIIPLIGTKRRSRLTEALAALDVTAQHRRNSRPSRPRCPLAQVAGDRYDSAGMHSLDSERQAAVTGRPARASCACAPPIARPPGR